MLTSDEELELIGLTGLPDEPFPLEVKQPTSHNEDDDDVDDGKKKTNWDPLYKKVMVNKVLTVVGFPALENPNNHKDQCLLNQVIAIKPWTMKKMILVKDGEQLWITFCLKRTGKSIFFAVSCWSALYKVDSMHLWIWFIRIKVCMLLRAVVTTKSMVLDSVK
jgi:hypothetical protein